MSRYKLSTIRHSLAHILATAVYELYPNAKFGTGPATENGFYYDIKFETKIAEKDLQKIESKMKELIDENIPFIKQEISISQAKKIFENQPFKLELIQELSRKQKYVSVYQSKDFIDLCKGPHVRKSGIINKSAFKLTRIASAYWKGDEKNPMLTRIYGVAFTTKEELEKYLENLKEIKLRDHRTLGQTLELFMFDEEVGAGLPLWLPKGETLRHIIEEYLYKELKSTGYQWVRTPHIGNLKLWKTSGHWELYRENMYSPIEVDNQKYLLKPMNCPFHVKIYQYKVRSYKDLPLRYAELGTVYRYERTGVLHGLTRVRGFTQDDAHIWCTPAQLSDELTRILKQGLKILKTFGFREFNIYLSTRPEKYAGTIKKWQKATKSLKYVLNKLNLDYKIDRGGGVFYGPKIDIKIKDALGREWQCTTIQVDFNLPERFNIVYMDESGKKRQPIMIHRALLGSIERFIGILLEHYRGALPLWLSPIQVVILPIAKRHLNYAKKIQKQLNLRSEIWLEKQTLAKRIREAEIQKIPYMLIVGDREIKENQVAIRSEKKGDLGRMKLEQFLKEIKTKN